MKAVFTIEVRDEVKAYLLERISPGVELIFCTDFEREPLVEAARVADAIVGPRAVREILGAVNSIKLVQIPWAGVQNVYKDVAEHPGVILSNCHGNANAAAQYGVAMLLALANRLYDAHVMLLDGHWRDRFALHDTGNLKGKTAGILGAGNIGRTAASMLAPFGVELIGFRRRADEPLGEPFTATYGGDGLADFIERSDVLFLALPITPETKGLIGARELELLGPEGLLVNVGRGDVVSEDALFEALKEGKIAGAALDVWYDYRPEPGAEGAARPFNRPFHELGNCLMSPHRAGPTPKCPDHWADVVENLNRLAAGREDLLNVVDLEAGY